MHQPNINKHQQHSDVLKWSLLKLCFFKTNKIPALFILPLPSTSLLNISVLDYADKHYAFTMKTPRKELHTVVVLSRIPSAPWGGAPRSCTCTPPPELAGVLGLPWKPFPLRHASCKTSLTVPGI